MEKEIISKYDLIRDFASDTIKVIELISTNPYQTALKFVIDEAKDAQIKALNRGFKTAEVVIETGGILERLKEN